MNSKRIPHIDSYELFLNVGDSLYFWKSHDSEIKLEKSECTILSLIWNVEMSIWNVRSRQP